LIELIKNNSTDFNSALFPIVISNLESYSPNLFSERSKESTFVSKQDFMNAISKFSTKSISKECTEIDGENSEDSMDLSQDMESDSHEIPIENSTYFVSIIVKKTVTFPVNHEALKSFSFHSDTSPISLIPNSEPVNLNYNENVLQIIFKIVNNQTIPELNLNFDEFFQICRFVELNQTEMSNLNLEQELLENLRLLWNSKENEFESFMAQILMDPTLKYAQRILRKLFEVAKKRKRESCEIPSKRMK
jgi:hypothetical protein